MPSNQFAEVIAIDLAQGRLLELAEIYAIDALTDAERNEIDEFVSTGPAEQRASFDQRVRQTRETLVSAFALEEADPPASLLENILAQLPQVSRTPGAVAAESVAAVEAGPTDELSVRRERKAARGGLSTGRRWLIGAAAAAALIVGGIGVGANIITNQDPGHQILNAADVKTKTLDFPGGGSAKLAISGSKDGAVVTMNGVSAPPAGKVYQMWLLPKDGSAPISQGTMDAAALSKPATIKGVDDASAFAVTVEPDGGSAQPTLPPLAALPLSA
ncbi:anti-sigma factor [Arthrobacter sp. H14-L1]|uniref:anti-sigma factor n=1 Tax=Arthrobacter sp. H14-L1 TaxID=2996697 RepID=UPI00226ECB40|nr:anti-sigma factor [Arthrobacter sp. H14-L1]MCY0903520.1 anti-sigma factor [Arthrobacter sp. H14-L1]